MADEAEPTLEALEAIMADPSKWGEQPPEPTEPETVSAEPPAEPEPAQAAPEAEAAPQEPAEDKAPAEPEVSEIDILRAQLEEAVTRAKHMEQVAGKHGGEVGFLRRKIAELEGRIEAPRPAGEDSEPGYVPEPEEPPRSAARRQPSPQDPVREYIAHQAVNEAMSTFFRERPDWNDATSGMKDAFVRHAAEARVDLESLVREIADPRVLQQEVRGALEAAYWRASSDVKAERVRSLTEKRAAQISGMKDAKQKAAPAAPGATPPVRPKAPTPEEMSVAEADAWMRREFGAR